MFLLDLFKDQKKSKRNQRYILPFAFAVNVVLNLSNDVNITVLIFLPVTTFLFF